MIYVFKTSVKNKEQLKCLSPHIEKLLPNAKWNFDLEDCDKILRVETDEATIASKIAALLHRHQFHCEELE